MRASMGLAVAAVTVAWAANAAAHGPAYDHRFAVSLEDEAGQTLQTFAYQGNAFVLGRHGERYNVRVRNRTANRVEAVVTIDGRDAISGRVGDYLQERGYLIGPYDSVLIEGFRRNYDEVAAFRFADPQASYSARMGTKENVGVIGVAVFAERLPPLLVQPPAVVGPPVRWRKDSYGEAEGAQGPRDRAQAESKSRAAQAPRAQSGAPAADALGGLESRPEHAPSTNNLGTEYGETRTNQVSEVAFERDSRLPARVLTLRYDDEAGLVARGIDVQPRHAPAVYGERPDPFPRNRFAPPPPPRCGAR